MACDSAGWLASAFAPLGDRFGSGLSLDRDGDAARWAYDGQSAFVAVRPDGSLDAWFVDRAQAGSGAGSSFASAGVYRGEARYALSHDGSTRMVSDIADFFSGIREPRFTFVDVYQSPATS